MAKYKSYIAGNHNSLVMTLSDMMESHSTTLCCCSEPFLSVYEFFCFWIVKIKLCHDTKNLYCFFPFMKTQELSSCITCTTAYDAGILTFCLNIQHLSQIFWVHNSLCVMRISLKKKSFKPVTLKEQEKILISH